MRLQAAPKHENPVLASPQAKLALYQQSPFEKTIYLDCDICLLSPIYEVFDYLDEVDLLITEDGPPAIAKAANLLRVKQDILSTLQSVGLPLNENRIQYNGGFIAFTKSSNTQELFINFKKYFEMVVAHQNVLLLKDSGRFCGCC
ncbi:hypothetical protein QUA07_14515 [Microcoleus sp. T3_A4]|uniref:hypothetical protein n=1 Tax=Microcoleus sp. T3_A4 TaxID=2818968 RepID=UPI002FD228B3